jgi:hypothetical protein
MCWPETLLVVLVVLPVWLVLAVWLLVLLVARLAQPRALRLRRNKRLLPQQQPRELQPKQRRQLKRPLQISLLQTK